MFFDDSVLHQCSGGLPSLAKLVTAEVKIRLVTFLFTYLPRKYGVDSSPGATCGEHSALSRLTGDERKPLCSLLSTHSDTPSLLTLRSGPSPSLRAAHRSCRRSLVHHDNRRVGPAEQDGPVRMGFLTGPSCSEAQVRRLHGAWVALARSWAL